MSKCASFDDTESTDDPFDELPEVEDYTLMHAQYLLQELVEDERQPLSRRLEAAHFVYEISHDQEQLGAKGDLKPLFDYGGGVFIASLLVDGFKARWPDGKCTGTIIERDFMSYVYECALNVLNK